MNLGIAEFVIIAAVIGVAIYMLRGRSGGGSKERVEPLEIADAVHNPRVQEAMERGQKIEAIKYYRELTGVGLKESKDVIDYVMAGGDVSRKKRAAPNLDAAGGVRDLLKEGRRDEAVDLYARFAGVDAYTAHDAVDEIEREMRLEDEPRTPGKLSLVERGEISELLQRGNKIEAVKRYRELSGLGLKESKDAVDEMERGLK